MRTFFREFREGAFGPTRGSLAGTLAVTLVWIVLAAVIVTPEFLAENSAVALNARDDNTRITARALAFRYSRDRAPMVAAMGASGFRMALMSPDEFEAILEARLGRPIEVMDLTVGGLTVWEIASLVDHFPDGFEGVLLLGVGPGLLSYKARDLYAREQEIRFGLDSETRDDELRRAGYEPAPSTGIYFLDHVSFLVSLRQHWPRLLARAERIYPWRFKPWRRPYAGAEMEARCAMIRERLSDYFETREASLASLDRAIARLRSRCGSLEIVLVDNPRNPAYVGRAQPPGVLDDYFDVMRRYAAERGLPFLEANSEGILRTGDFLDECHIQEMAAARRYTTWIVNRIAPALERMSESESGR